MVTVGLLDDYLISTYSVVTLIDQGQKYFFFFVAVDACEQQTKSNVRQEAAEALLCMESPTSENKTFLQGISQPQHGKLLPDPQTPTNLNEGGFV